MISDFVDKDLGKINIIINKRAKRCIARRRNNCVQFTIPYGYNEKEMFEVFNELKPKILDLPVNPKFLFSPVTEFRTCTFVVKICVEVVTNFYCTLKKGVLTIVCPSKTNFSDEDVQQFISSKVEVAMRIEAKRFLPSRVVELSSKYNFDYKIVKINKSKTRWGSCSGKKIINLSYYCMLLPTHLVDFIILHELCHTIEMNHGVNFWRLLDSVTNSKAKLYTNELKSYSTHW